MRGLLITIMLIASASAFAATTVYTWVDSKGETHYSDQPHPGARKLEVNGAPTFNLPPEPRVHHSVSPSAAPHRPESCSISSPTDHQMLMNVWSLSGQVRLPADFMPGDDILLRLDGKVLRGVTRANGAFHLAHIDRGAHTLAAQVETPDGRVICQAPAVTFYVHQPSRLAPHHTARPRF